MHLARECESVDTEIKNKYMLIVAKRDGLNEENTEVEVDENKLSAE